MFYTILSKTELQNLTQRCISFVKVKEYIWNQSHPVPYFCCTKIQLHEKQKSSVFRSLQHPVRWCCSTFLRWLLTPEWRKSWTPSLAVQCPDFTLCLENGALRLVSGVFSAQRSIEAIYQGSTMVFIKKALKFCLSLDDKTVPWILFLVSDGDMPNLGSQALLCNWMNSLDHSLL